MGIKNYKTNLTETFPSIISNKKPKNISTLCIDSNGILHKVCHRTKNRNKFKKLLINTIKRELYTIKPSTLAIFVDGQAILAKAQTQIKRRNKYLYSSSSGISPLNLTPGTPFMDYVDNIINEFLSKLSIKTFYSSSKINNEGEIKLFEWLINNNIKDRVCVMGNDADLIVLALAKRPLLDLYIYNDNKYLSLFKLVENLSKLTIKKFNYSWHPVRMDFVLISLFQGNDYNKRVSNFEKIFKSYCQLQKNGNNFLIQKDNRLNLINIKKLFEKISINDTEVCHSEDVIKYFKCIQWNINLYNGKTINNFIPDYKNITINSILKYIPNKIEILPGEINWLNPQVYTLLLMPSTGKQFLPQHLQKLLNDDSPIKDLFPDPCIECIEWKNKLRNVIIPSKDATNKEKEEYKSTVSTINKNYSNHIEKNHSIDELPIKRIEDAVNNIN